MTIEYRVREIEPHTTSWGQKIRQHFEAEAIGHNYFYGAEIEAVARDGIQAYIRSVGGTPKEVTP